MKKNVFVGLVIVLSIFLVSKLFNKSEVYEEEKSIKNNNALSMMVEQNAGAGDYELETRSSWPTEGYIFNSTLSKCENGSKLSWDDETSSVVFSGSVSDKCYVYFDKYQYITIDSSTVTVSGTNITITINATAGTGSISKYYYSKDNGQSYVDSTSNTYTFINLENGIYTIKYYVEDSNRKKSEIISKEATIKVVYLANYIKSLYTGTQGENNLYYHNSTLTNGAGDNSYRYAGAHDEVNNFVCFGSDADICPTDNLYRIIGVFDDQVKLIKWDYATSTLLGTDGDYKSSCSTNSGYCTGTNKGANSTSSIGVYYWHSTSTNTWNTSKLNTVNLNTNFINNIGSTWANKIATTTWKVGGNTYDNIYNKTASVAYKNEYTNPAETTTYTNKIALMYTSDYGFAVSPSAWTTTLYNYYSSDESGNKITDENWMYMGLPEWTVVRQSGSSYEAFFVRPMGLVDFTYVYYSGSYFAWAVRPVFYLNSNVIKVGDNTGTKSDPIRIS